MHSLNSFIQATTCLTLASVTSLGLTLTAQADLTLSADKPIAIILPAQTIPPEETAAQELQHYLGQITGATAKIQREGEPLAAGSAPIYVGATQFGNRHVKGAKTFGDEEWLMQTEGDTLILTGGRPRGTLYAAYRFLEEVGGVRWWSAWEESVPKGTALNVPTLAKRGQPSFRTRDIFTIYGNDEGRFMARNRLNRQGDAKVSAKYGGSRDYGPPYHVHTWFKFLPPEKYFKDHPEWYLVPGGGAPNVRTSQLCLANEEMRREFLKVLRETIRTASQKAIAEQLPPPYVYSVSQEDNRTSYACEHNQKLAEQEGSEAAVLLDFVNYLADGIKDEFPDVYLDTLAYFNGEKAPKNMRARDNVIIRLTDTQSNVLLPVTAERNRAMRENVEAWAKQCKNLRIWDYAITYDYPQVPTPNLSTFAPDLRFFLKNNVEGMFIEFEEPLKADMREVKLWVLIKLLEDPSQDPEALIKEFTDGFYGPAAPQVRQYLTLLQKAADASGADVDWFAKLPRFNYLTLDFLQQADRIFEQAANNVSSDPVLSQRVRNARATVDIAIIRRYRSLVQQWVQSGKSQDTMPLDRNIAAKRYVQSWKEQIDLRLPEAVRAASHRDADAAMEGYTMGPAYLPAPAKFKDVPSDRLFTYSALDTRNYRNHAKVVADAEAESGMATRLEVPPSELGRYKMPTAGGVYSIDTKANMLTGSIQAADVPGPGYHWYKLGETKLTGSDYLYITWAWWIQADLIDAYNPQAPDTQYEVWASLKFEGPDFPHPKAGDKNAVYVERMALVKK